MMTPSAPFVKALMTRFGWTIPEHITRMILTFGGYCSLETPAKSAPV